MFARIYNILVGSIHTAFAIILVSILVLLIFIFYPRSITVAAVPFGLPSGTKIAVGEKAEFSGVPNNAQAQLRRAYDLRIAGALESAFSNYETILLKYPNTSAALFGAAYSLLAGDSVSGETIAKAKGYIETLSKEKAGSVWVQLLLILMNEREGNFDNSLEMAVSLASESPAFSEARLALANLYLNGEQAKKAADEARVAISISGGADARPYITLAFALHKSGLLEQCSELVNYALPRFPSQTDLLLLQGYLSEYARDFDKAQEIYKRILALRPGNISAQNAIATLGEKIPPSVLEGGGAGTVGGGIAGGGAVLSLKDIAGESAKILLPLINDYPENLPLREALGKIYLRARLNKEANSQFREIYSQDQEYPNIRQMLDLSAEETPKFTPSPAATNFGSLAAASSENSKLLADSLAASIAALRSSGELEDKDGLGRYLAHYGATFKEFFSRYSVSRFKKIEDRDFSETYSLGSFNYNNTIFFDRKKKFYAVRVEVKDTAESENFGYISDLFGHFLKKESGVLGEGVVVEPAECDGAKWSGVIWISRDNFEILMQNAKNPRSIYIIRLHAKRFPDTGNICSYVPMALGKKRVP